MAVKYQWESQSRQWYYFFPTSNGITTTGNYIPRISGNINGAQQRQFLSNNSRSLIFKMMPSQEWKMMPSQKWKPKVCIEKSFLWAVITLWGTNQHTDLCRRQGDCDTLLSGCCLSWLAQCLLTCAFLRNLSSLGRFNDNILKRGWTFWAPGKLGKWMTPLCFNCISSEQCPEVFSRNNCLVLNWRFHGTRYWIWKQQREKAHYRLCPALPR